MNLRMLSFLHVFFLLPGSLAAMEADGEGRKSTGTPRPGGPDFGKFLKLHDLDGDGRVSPTEFAASERAGRLSEEARAKIFDRLDKNGDGFIAADELQLKRRDRALPFLKKADTDGDGRINRAEFLANPPFPKVAEKRLNRMFDHMDQNGDGFLDAKDPRARRNRGRPPHGPRPPRFNLRDLDRDKNGGLSWEEFQEAPFLKKLPGKEKRQTFDRIDEDRDGEISPQEMRSHFAEQAPRPPRGPHPRGPKPGPGPQRPDPRK